MAAKKTAAKKKATQVGRTGSSIPATAPSYGSTNKYETIGDVMRAASKGAPPRGAKFVIANGRARLCVNTKNAGVTLYDGDAAEVARWGLRKAGFKADHAV